MIIVKNKSFIKKNVHKPTIIIKKKDVKFAHERNYIRRKIRHILKNNLDVIENLGNICIYISKDEDFHKLQNIILSQIKK